QCEFGEGDCNSLAHYIGSPSPSNGTSYTDNMVTTFRKTAGNTVPTSVYYYYIKAVNTAGLSSQSNKQSANSGDGWITKQGADGWTSQSGTPNTFGLYENYPNPFNPLTVIRYQLSEDSHVQLRVFNTLGTEVATLVDGMQNAGYKSVEFDASTLPSGVYFYRFTATHSGGQTGSFNDVKKMLLAK
ncbi:MAG: T9SS type A sorting domain-containing protein, partial [Ignavibacteriales bacterium]|nr:T9SS type A sorting domain-containing protein [Ignavibacteriales bacterium]